MKNIYERFFQNNKVFTWTFCVLLVFNLLFPPMIEVKYKRKFFNFLFEENADYKIDVPILFVLIILSIVVSFLVSKFVEQIKANRINNNSL